MKSILAAALLGLCVLVAGCDENDIPPECRVGDASLLDTSKNPETPAPDTDAEISLDPDSLRTALFKGNVPLIIELNRVKQAKDIVNEARLNLLPQANLGALISTGARPDFLLSSVEVLLPFLVPSNWFDYWKTQEILEAEKLAFRLLKLNSYASAYSLYFAANADLEGKRLLEQQVADLQDLEEYIEHLHQAGLASDQDLSRARGERGLAQISVSKINNLVNREVAQIRHALGLGLRTQITLLQTQAESVPWESANPADVSAEALAVSLEAQQLLHLSKAAEHDRWSKTFGFLTGASVSAGKQAGGDLLWSFDKLRTGATMNFGFGIFPAIQLANDQKIALEEEKGELLLQINDTLETAISSVKEAKSWLATTLGTQVSFQDAYDSELNKYRAGVGRVVDLLAAHRDLRQASAEVIHAQNQLDLSRVMLHRLMLTDQFAKIEGCNLKKN